MPHITKNLLPISKLTLDFPVDVLFTDNSFLIQHRITRDLVAKGRRENGLYVLEHGQAAFVVALRNKKLQASFKLWYNRLGREF